MNSQGRIARRFAALKAEGRAGLVAFLTAGDPDRETSLALVRGLPGAGADLIEIGMPFTDPMADGPAIQAASLRALAAGMTLSGTLDLVRAFRTGDAETPVILMGYFNPIYRYGVARFLTDAKTAGVDGLIVVDLPPEEDEELCLPALAAGISFIRLATPTTDDARLPAEEGYETEIGSYDTDEGPMRVAGVPPQPVPTLKVRRHGELVASFFPDACWIIGVLGRVSIFTGRHRPHTLVEKDFPEERKGWWFRRHDIEERYLASQRDFSILMGVPFTREVLRQLVEVSHG